jgi:predicted acetyltransferase
MSKVKKIRLKDIPKMVEISINAYPGFGYPNKDQYIKRVEETQRKNPFINYYGCYRQDKLIGVQRIHDFRMNYRGKMISAAGVGGVAVDLLNKKEKVCRDLISYFVQYAQKKEAAVAILYPFRPDFYFRMGFGYGSPLFQYNLDPKAFPTGNSKEHLRFLNIDDIELMVDCYNNYARDKHGLCLKNRSDFKGFLKNPENRIIGYLDGKKLKGYLVAKFVKAHDTNFVINNLEILEMIYSNGEVFSEISTFLNSQSDQVKRIILNTFDPEFYQLLNDVRKGTDNLFPSVFHDSHSAGIGIMYKIVDLKKFFSMTDNFGKENIVIRFVVEDNFSTQKNDPLTVDFRQGRPTIKSNQTHNVELRMGIAEFSSLVMGALSFNQAYSHGKVEISNSKYVAKIHQLFYGELKPQCLSWF